jgi:hypothetical protein
VSLLDDLRSKTNTVGDTEAYKKALGDCPPVSAGLLAYLDKMFSRRSIKPNEPTMQQELVFQAGVDKVLQHLRGQNERQEQDIRSQRTK